MAAGTHLNWITPDRSASLKNAELTISPAENRRLQKYAKDHQSHENGCGGEAQALSGPYFGRATLCAQECEACCNLSRRAIGRSSIVAETRWNESRDSRRHQRPRSLRWLQRQHRSKERRILRQCEAQGLSVNLSIIGRKGRDYFRRRSWPIRQEWAGVSTS